ncbi:O-antigen ligase family protein [Chloroflexota bacterium]
MIYSWSDASTRLPVFTLGEWIRVLSLPLVATILLVMVIVWGTSGFSVRDVSRPRIRGNLPIFLTVTVSCLLAAVGTISIIDRFELHLALPIILAFTALLAVIIFSVTRTEKALLIFFIILPVLEFICLNLRTSLNMKGSVLILPAEFIGFPMPRVAWGQGFAISGIGHFVAMPSEVLFIAVISLGFLLTMLTNRARWVRTPLDRLILGFVVVCLVSSCFSSDVALSMSYVVEGIITPVILYYLIINMVKTQDQLKMVLAAMFFYVILGGAYQLYRVYESTEFAMAALSSERWIVMSSSVSSLAFAGTHTLIMLIPVAFVLCSAKEPGLLLRAWAFLVVILGYAVILLNFQRGVWLAAAVQIVLLVIFSRKVRSFAMVLAPLVLFLGLLFGGWELLAGILQMRPTAYLGFGSFDISILERFFVWREAWKLMIAHPLAGIGLGTFASAFVLWRGYLPMQNAHQLFLGVGAEAGIIAVLLLITIFAMILKEGVSLMRMKSLDATSSKNLVLGLLVGIIGYIIVGVSTGVSLSYKHFILTTLVLWAIIGLLMAYRNFSHRQI